MTVLTLNKQLDCTRFGITVFSRFLSTVIRQATEEVCRYVIVEFYLRKVEKPIFDISCISFSFILTNKHLSTKTLSVSATQS